jgi:DNA invertase Pin-like site-specific DNA recombinase
LGTLSPETQKKEVKVPANKLAVSYQRVSTKGQVFPRQKKARDQWLANHPEFELIETLEEKMSGRKKDRFEWFIKNPVKYPPGTVLLVEDIDRFSRMEVEEGIRELLAIFDAGLGIAVCPYEDDDTWNRLGIITDLNTGGEEILRELKRARRESERKRERRLGAVDEKWEAIREGNLSKAFKPRGKSKSAKDYPFWLEFHAQERDGRGVFKANEHWPLIVRIWELARTMGGARIAQVLKEEAFKSPHPRKGKEKFLSPEVVRFLLKNRTVVGEFQPRRKNNKPAGPAIPGVFPPVISQDEWREIRGIIEDRDTGLGATRSKKKHNLFEKRSFCAQCGGLMGWSPQTSKQLADGSMRHYPGNYRCRVGHKDHDACNVEGKQVGTPYNEVALLEMLHDFRWEARYSSTSHDEEVTQARQHLLALEEVQDAKQRIVDNIKQGISKALMEGQAPNPVFTETLKEADAALVEAENAVAIADRKLAALKSKTVGKAAAREARAKLKAFMNSRLDTTQNERGSMSGFTARGWWLWLIQERSEPRSTLQKLSETASLKYGIANGFFPT